MTRKRNVRNITKVKRCVRAISPVIATLLMIAITVVAALVAYAWISGYIGGTTAKTGNSIQIQSFAAGTSGKLVVYVQNVGQGSVQLNPSGAVYINNSLYQLLDTADNPLTSPVSIPEGQTVTLTVRPTGYSQGNYVVIKVVTSGGTSTQASGTGTGGQVGTQYSVTFSLGTGGQSVSPPGTQSYSAGARVPVVAVPLTNYVFTQWTSTGSITFDNSQAASTMVTINSAGTVTATFTSSPTQYTVNFNLGSGGLSMSPNAQQAYAPDAAITVFASPDATHAFSQWTADTGSITFDNPNSASTTAHIGAAGTITATFTLPSYSVQFVLGSGGDSMSPTGSQSYSAGSSVPISATPDATHSFVQWTATGSITFDSATSASTNAHINGAGTITATFALAQYSVQFVLGSGGSSMSPTGTQSYGAGASVAISAAPDGTHVFTQWTATGSITFDSATSASTNAHINGAGTITANFGSGQYSVIFVLGSGGASMSPTGTQNYDAGSAVAISATPDATHSFVQWTATGSITFDSATSASTNAHINGAGTITATFTATQYNVNFVLGSGGATMSPSVGVHTYDAGASVPISAIADGTHSFVQWTATGSITFDNAASASTNAHINGQGTISATFSVTQYQVTFSSNLGGTIATGDMVTFSVTGGAYSGATSPISVAGGSITVDAGATVNYAFLSPVTSSSPTDTQYIWAFTSGLGQTLQSNAFTVSATGTITATYGTQYKVTFDASSNVKSDSAANLVIVNTAGYTLPWTTGWLTSGVDTLNYAFQSPIVSTASPTNTRYIWSSTDGLSQTLQSNTFTVSAAGTVTGTYLTQYDTSTTLTAIATPLTAGQTGVTFSGTVSAAAAVPNGQNVVLQYSATGSAPWTTAATVTTTGGTGAFSGTFTAPAASTYYFQAYFAAYTSGGNNWQTSTSSQQTINVYTHIYTTTTTLNAITTPLTAGQTGYAFSGSVTSGTAVPNGAPVVLQYSASTSGPWTTATTVNTAGGSGGFSGTFTAPATAGTYYFQAYFAAYVSSNNDWQTSTSSQQTITVYTHIYSTTTTLNTIGAHLHTGQTSVAFSGSVTASTAVPNGAPVVLQYSASTSGPWTTATTVNTAGGSGGFSGTFTAPATAGTYYFQAYFAAYVSSNNDWQTSTSSQQKITVGIAQVQGPAHAGSTSTIISVSLSSTPTSGNTLIAVIGTYHTNSGTARTVSSIAETGVTWTMQTRQTDTSGSDVRDIEIWLGTVSSGASTSISITLSGSLEGAVADVCEYSGLAASPLDKTAGNANYGTSTSTGTTSTTTQASELWIGGTMVQGNSAQTSPTNGFTDRDGATYNSAMSLSYLEKIVSATGAANSGTTISTSRYWVGCIAAFKEA
jgi:flagellin-like protein